MVLQGDCRQTLRTLPEKSVHCVVTSPPYWSLRSYLPEDHVDKASELGGESTPDEYISNVVSIFGEVWRVLRDDGVCFINLGDTAARGGCGGNPEDSPYQMQTHQAESIGKGRRVKGMSSLNKLGIPERFVLAMQIEGWIWRDTIIWHKPSPMPSSVSGVRWERCRIKKAKGLVSRNRGKVQSHPNALWEDCAGCEKCKDYGGYRLRRGAWRTSTAHEPIFMFTKTDDYFCDAFTVKEPAETSTKNRNKYTRKLDDPDEVFAIKHDHEFVGLTRNPRSVWRIANGGSSLQHYAMFPVELPRRLIEIATSNAGVCSQCGNQWAPLIERTKMPRGDTFGKKDIGEKDHGQQGTLFHDTTSTCSEYRPTCNCNAPIEPAIVMDPFGGSGTTAEAAIGLGRECILCELNSEYCDIITKRMETASAKS